MCNYLPNYYVFCVMIVQTLHSMLKSSKNITHMHRCHASIVIKSRTVALFWGKIAVHFALFSDKFTRLARILHDRRSHRSRQISALMNTWPFGRKTKFTIAHLCVRNDTSSSCIELHVQIHISACIDSKLLWQHSSWVTRTPRYCHAITKTHPQTVWARQLIFVVSSWNFFKVQIFVFQPFFKGAVFWNYLSYL